MAQTRIAYKNHRCDGCGRFISQDEHHFTRSGIIFTYYDCGYYDRSQRRYIKIARCFECGPI